MMPFARARLRPALLLAWMILLTGMAVPMLGWSQSAADGGPVGLLLAAGENGATVAAPRLATDYDIDVSGPVARTRVTQRFVNPTDRWVEGVYVFPLPEKAAVDTLSMVIGSRIVVGEIEERAAARRAYDEAAASGRRASLVEQQRPNVFTTSVANIGPGESIVVQIEYQETVRQDGTRYSLRVPLVVAPRYTPPALRQEASADALRHGWATREAWQDAPVLDPGVAPPANPVTLQIRLQAGFPLEAVESAHHKIVVRAAGDDARLVALAEGEVPAGRDFELAWRPKASAAPSIGLFRERVGDADYLLAMVVPPVVAAAERRPAREAIFVFDTSGSMAGASIEQARAALIVALDGLKPDDRFNVVRFASDATSLFRAPVPADAGAIARARDWVSRLAADGGTEMVPALAMALADTGAGRRGEVRQVIFLTDGAIGNETQVFDLLAQARGRSRIFMVGIGAAPNSHLMARAAEIGRGSFTHIGSAEQVEDGMRALFAKLESPVATALEARFAAGNVDATPNPLPDLYAGEPVVLLARAPHMGGSVTLSGNIGERPWSAMLPTDGVQEGHGIAKLWARRRIDSLEASAILGAIDRATRDRDILALALEHHLVTRLTSLVAVDRTPARPEGEPLARADIPLNLPAGWQFEKVFGPALERHARLAAPAPMQIAAVAAPPPAMTLPQTATPAALLTAGGLVAVAGGLALLLAGRPPDRQGIGVRRRLSRLAGGALLLGGLAVLAQGLWIPAKAVLAQILLDRAFAASAAAGQPVKAWSWADTWPVARLAVPRHGIEQVVLGGASGEALAFGPALLDGTVAPGEAGSSVIAGHRDTHFAFLGALSPGDSIEIARTDGRRFTFIVRDTRVVAWDSSGIDPAAEGRWLVLTTCWPLDARLPGPQRYLVVAEAVPGAAP